MIKNKLKEIGASRHVDGEVAVLVELALRAPDKASTRTSQFGRFLSVKVLSGFSQLCRQ